jgi:hydrophobic/amphiphilic exporter-1 (mainly G- bacteria), HAE1 family
MIRYFAGHPTAANLLMLLLIAAGLMALPTLRRETFPDFSVDVVEVRVVYPGASAEEVEEAICQRIEDAVDRLTNVDEVRCEAREGLGSAAIEMRPGQDVDRFLVDVKTEIEAIDDFPDAVETITIRQINVTDPVVSIAIAGPMAAPDLKVYAEQIKARLVRLPEVSQVAVQGFADRQIRIALDDFALRQQGLSVTDVAEIVSRQSIDLPAGTVETQERDVLLRFADQRRSVQAFEDLVVIGGEGGAELRLGDLAEITDLFERAEERILLNGERAALLEVTKTKDQDTLTVMAAVERFVEREQASAPQGVTFALTRDVASIVEDRLTMLLSNGVQGIGLVFLVLWLFFSFRFSFWVAMGLPASFLGALFGIWLIGYSIDMLTMVALLIAVGLLMDDAIVIAENIARHLQLGKTRLEAAVDGTREVAMGVIASFVTSVCVFAPLAFLEGDIGKVLKVVPVVLIIVLSVSLVEAFLILPHHLAHAMVRGEPGRFRRGFDGRFEAVREQALGRLVDAAVRWRYLTIGLVLMLFLLSLAMVAGGILKFRAFPDLDGDTIEARILLPAGTPFADTKAVVARVVAGLEEIDAKFTPRQPPGADGQPRQLVRNVLVQYNTNADAFEAGPHVATVTADLLTAEVRDAPVDEIFRLWRETVGTLPDVISLTFKEPQVGPAGLPIEIRLQGDDLVALKAASQDLQGWLASFAGVTDLIDDLRPGKPEIQLRLREGAFGLGLDATEIARQLRAAYYGSTAAEIQVGPESFEIDVRLADAAQSSLGDLDDFAVALPGGRRVPLTAVAEVETGRGVARIARVDGRRTVTLRGEVDNRIANLNQILARTSQAFLPELLGRYPDVSVSLEGEAEEQEKTGASLQRGFLLGLLGIFLLLSFQFKSYVEPLIVMVAIPLAAIGVIWGHMAMGLDLTMPSMLGAASLAGVVVNDSILLVAFVKLGRRSGAADDVVAAASQAARQRFRPVLLTSLTTIAGLLPLLFERSLQAQVLVPLVTSLAFGLMASTVLVLIVVPALYATLNDLGLTTLAREDAEIAPATPLEVS